MSRAFGLPARQALSVVLAAMVGGCASFASEPVGCDGRHRRPVNIQGASLSAGPPAQAALAEAPDAASIAGQECAR